MPAGARASAAGRDFRPAFLGHILVEILLDAALIADDPGRLDAYYAAHDAVDGQWSRRPSTAWPGVPVDELARFVGLFSRERFLWDYLDDGKLLMRLNQVMRRVKLPALPAEFVRLLPAARQLVAERQAELISPPARVQLASERIASDTTTCL